MPITKSYSPDIFTLIPMSTLSQQHFEQHPIWSEYYEFDEREEIVEWGVDAAWLHAELKRVNHGNDHCAYPILRPYPLPCRMRQYIKARIVTADNQLLGGYVMNADAWVLSIFVTEDEFCFSRHPSMSDANIRTLARLKAAAPQLSGNVFPLKYETDFLDSDGNLIAGEFPLTSSTS